MELGIVAVLSPSLLSQSNWRRRRDEGGAGDDGCSGRAFPAHIPTRRRERFETTSSAARLRQLSTSRVRRRPIRRPRSLRTAARSDSGPASSGLAEPTAVEPRRVDEARRSSVGARRRPQPCARRRPRPVHWTRLAATGRRRSSARARGRCRASAVFSPERPRLEPRPRSRFTAGSGTGCRGSLSVCSAPWRPPASSRRSRSSSLDWCCSRSSFRPLSTWPMRWARTEAS